MTTSERQDHSVTHIAYEDAEAYAAWTGRELPSEAEWECAARGGLDGAIFAWGDEERPRGELMAISWQGDFPCAHRRLAVARHLTNRPLSPVSERLAELIGVPVTLVSAVVGPQVRELTDRLARRAVPPRALLDARTAGRIHSRRAPKTKRPRR